MLITPRLILSLLAVIFIMASAELPAKSAIHRCIDKDGVHVFADRSCSDLGVHEFDTPLALPSLLDGCSREVEMLESWIRAALDSGDINHLAGLYHWTGATPYKVETQMPYLQELTQRSLIDIEIDSAYVDGIYLPVRIWLEQHDPKRPDTTIRSGFFLVQSAGCWWLRSLGVLGLAGWAG